MSIANLIKAATKGRFFRITFERRDGTIRNITARCGVTKHLRGGQLNYDPQEKNLVNVFDVAKKDYRSFSVDRLLSFRCGAIRWDRA